MTDYELVAILHPRLDDDGVVKMTEWVQGQVKPEEMIQPEDLAETVRLLLRTSRHCLIPEVVFSRPGDPSAFAT